MRCSKSWWLRSNAGLLIAWALLTPSLAAAAPQQDAAERLLFDAEQKARDGDREAALRGYDLVAQEFPESPEAARALLLAAQGRAAGGDLDAAAVAAQRVIDTHSRSPQAAGAMVQLGQIQTAKAVSNEGLEAARDTFQSIPTRFGRAKYPGLVWRSAALVSSGDLSLSLGLPEEAARDFVDVMDLEPVSVWTLKARLGLAKVLLFRGQWESAAEILQGGLADAAMADLGEDSATAEIRRRLTLIHRLYLRPAAGELRWKRARSLSGGDNGLKRPMGIAASEAGSFLLSQGGEPTSVEIASTGRVLGSWKHPDARKPSWGASGERNFVTADAVFTAGSAGRTIFEAAPPDKGDSLQNLEAVEPSTFGRWFVLARKPNRVLLYSRRSRHRKTVTPPKSSEPADIVADPRGGLLVLDPKQGRVQRFDAEGSSLGIVVSGVGRKAIGLTVDAAGNTYILDRESASVRMFGPGGKQLALVGPDLPNGIQLRRPVDITIDGAGRLMILDDKLAAVVVLE